MTLNRYVQSFGQRRSQAQQPYPIVSKAALGASKDRLEALFARLERLLTKDETTLSEVERIRL